MKPGHSLRGTAVAAAAATTVLALTLSACGSGAGSGGSSAGSGAAASSGTLTLGALNTPTSQLAAESSWANSSIYVQAVYDSLLHEDPSGGLKPWLATSWSYNADKTVLTMKLRNDVTFTDGTKFDASVAAQNVLRFRDGTSKDKNELRSVKDATAVDDSTLQITLSQPDPALLLYLAQDPGAQESPQAFTSPDAKTKPVGSGPYVLDTASTVVGSKYVYTKNPHYWAPDQQHYAKLVINIYQTPSAQVDAVRGGQVNFLPLFDNDELGQVKASGFTTSSVQNSWVGLILFDRDGKQSPALGDVRVRQAINYALDRKAILKAAGQGLGTTTTQIFAPYTQGYDKSLDTKYPYDPAKAKQLLAEAGYGDGKLSIALPQVAGVATTSYDLTKQYLGDVGITVNYQPETVGTIFRDLLAPKFPAAQFQLSSYLSAWQQAVTYIAPTATWNPFHVSDATVAPLLQTIQTGSSSDADAASRKLDQYLVDQAWFAPIYLMTSNYGTDPHTTVTVQRDNSYPYLWNFTPKA